MLIKVIRMKQAYHKIRANIQIFAAVLLHNRKNDC